MPDPFETLASTLAALGPNPDPEPQFASRLRGRLARALDLPKGVTVSNIQSLELEHEIDDQPALTSMAAITPYLAVSGAEDALDWYAGALGARLVGRPIVMPDGRIGHAELDIAGAPLMLSEEHPEIGVVAPAPGGGVPVTLHLSVVDVDAVIDRAVSAGARLERAAVDYEYGRNGVIRDPFGHRWLISGQPQPEPQPAGFREGDIAYASLNVPDVQRAAAFFTAVLGWRYDPGSTPQGRRVEGLALHHGLWGGVDRPTLFCCYAVADVAAAAERVQAAGGTAGPAHQEPYGLISDCVDDQGVSFALFGPPGGVLVGDRVSDGNRVSAGDAAGALAYVTVETVDSARTREFYGSVLGWSFTPGRVADGWQVDDVAPMIGISGGHALATTVPMYRVDDIAAAVSAVRGAGGTATDPEVQPYGITSTCTDDQGTRFYLGQL